MRRFVATALVAIMLVTAGCNGFLDTGNSTDGGTPGTAPETTAPPTTSPPQTPTPSPQEQEYLTSGKEFTRVMGIRLNRTHGMYITDRGFYRNNTVSMSYRLDEGTPLYKSMMNVSQTVSVIVPVRTTTDEDEAMQGDINTGMIHRPEMVYVRIVDPDGNRIGTFQVDPDEANQYRRLEMDADVFGQNVVDTLDLEGDADRGDRSLEWYLNRSQLHDWKEAYINVLRADTDPDETVYESEFPVEGIEIHPDEMRVHHELTWYSEVMGQEELSGIADINSVYYETVDRGWAMSPHRLSYYFDKPDARDIRGHMDLESVLWLLGKDNREEYLNDYLNMAETEIVDEE